MSAGARGGCSVQPDGPPCLRYFALNYLANHGNFASTPVARLCRRRSPANVKTGCALARKIAKGGEGRLIAGPRLLIRGSRVRVPDGTPHFSQHFWFCSPDLS